MMVRVPSNRCACRSSCAESRQRVVWVSRKVTQGGVGVSGRLTYNAIRLVHSKQKLPGGTGDIKQR